MNPDAASTDTPRKKRKQMESLYMFTDFIWKNGEVTANAMYERSGLSKMMVDELTAECLRRGLIRCYTKDDGHRPRIYSLTRSGYCFHVFLSACVGMAPIGFTEDVETGELDLDSLEFRSAVETLREMFVRTEYILPSKGEIVTVETKVRLDMDRWPSRPSPLSRYIIIGRTMDDPIYREDRPLMPRNLSLTVAAVLASTLVCMLICGSSVPSWTIAASAAIFAAAVLICFAAKLDVSVYPDRVEILFVTKRIVIPREEILDKRAGELGDIRSYSNWNLKGVKHQNFSRVGDDDGVSLKLMGKRVVTVSSADCRSLLDAIPTEGETDA